MGGCQVLVVDDERDFLDSLVRRLQRRGKDAHGVDSGEKALGFLAEYPCEVVVLDIKMPGMDGMTVLRAIRERHPGVEVILLTGHASVESGVEGLNLGAFDYLIKPVRLESLMERIEEAMERRQVLREMGGKG